MVNYEDHLAWLDRQVMQAQSELDAIIAERHGFLEAKRNACMMDCYAQSRLVQRYRIGWETGKMKLKLERKEEACETNP